MSTQAAFQRGITPLLHLLLSGRESLVLDVQPEPQMIARIETLASKSTEGELTEDEREEYEGYIRANKFVAILRRQAMRMKGVS